MAEAALKLVPPIIRTTLIEDSAFREEYGLASDAVLSFSALSVKRSHLFNAIRKLYSGKSEVKVTDTEDRKWKLKNISVEGGVPKLVLSRYKQCLNLPDFGVFSQDMVTRLGSLDAAASKVNLPGAARDRWRKILSKRALQDDEFEAFYRDYRETPIDGARSIRDDIVGGKSHLSSLVPASRKYFERLVGLYDGSKSVRDYAAGPGRATIRELSGWRPYDGFLSSLFLSSHPSLTAEINIEQLGDGDLIRALEFLEKHGDRISQLGAIEVGLRVLSSRPEIEPGLIRLISQIRDDNATSQGSGFRLLSALFILVDGELSRARMFSAEPPFYRRLAALSQAALIQRQLLASKVSVDIDAFCGWAINLRVTQFWLQSLTDLRKERRWNPDFADASQMKADFLGRIMIAARTYEKDIKSPKLSELVLGSKPGSLQAHSDFFHPYLPGPLEGAEESQSPLPAEWAETIRRQLNAETITPTSFMALVNCAFHFRLDAGDVELAARALKLGSHRIVNVEDRRQLLAVLNGLATVACVARSSVLADELRILVRRYRRDGKHALSVQDAIMICVVCAASRAELNDWREFLGDWLTELAFGDLDGDEGVVLHSHLRYLCHAVPELWISCGRPDAALMAYNASTRPS